MNQQELPSPTSFGWREDEDGNLTIEWNTVLPAPEEILDLMFCTCPRQCTAGSCPCVDNGLYCTDACKKKNCDNLPEDDVIDARGYIVEDEMDGESDTEDSDFFKTSTIII